MSFAKDIKPLFRQRDREAMEWAFDLWSYDDVKNNADLILERIEDESMPCDEPWDQTRIRTLHDWVSEGYPP